MGRFEVVMVQDRRWKIAVVEVMMIMDYDAVAGSGRLRSDWVRRQVGGVPTNSTHQSCDNRLLNDVDRRSSMHTTATNTHIATHWPA